MSRSHRAPTPLTWQIWKLVRQQSCPVEAVATLMGVPPGRIERLVAAMDRRRSDRMRYLSLC